MYSVLFVLPLKINKGHVYDFVVSCDFSLEVDDIRSHLRIYRNMNSWKKVLLHMIQGSNHVLLYDEPIFV